MTTLPDYIYFRLDPEDPDSLKFVPIATASLEKLRKAAQSAEADFNKAAVELAEAKYHYQVLQATLNMLAPIMEGNPEMTVAEAVLLAGGSVTP